ncbi:hypothetical protein SSCG_00207 [Streptomyces clavuligerus]|nr:hypothetical protein SSCG_00207 [Streptomyces clavuligerus]
MTRPPWGTWSRGDDRSHSEVHPRHEMTPFQCFWGRGRVSAALPPERVNITGELTNNSSRLRAGPNDGH